MSNPKVQDNQKLVPSKLPIPLRNVSMSTFPEDEIRTRAYQIYEARGRGGNCASEDWSLAETELMELVGNK